MGGFNEAAALKPRKDPAAYPDLGDAAGFNEAAALKPRKAVSLSPPTRDAPSLQ